MTDTSAARTTRRDLLRTGTIGAAAAAFLAACTAKLDQPGQSGLDPTTTLVAPTVPLETPSEADKAADLTVLMTMTSVELLASELYGTYGPVLTDAAWAAEAERFATDHGAAAEEHAAATPEDLRVTEPNAVLMESTVAPIEDQLTSDGPILALFAGVERSLAATYLTAVGAFTTREGRASISALGAAAARRAALLGNGGEGIAPTGPLYNTTDLITSNAYIEPGDTTSGE